METQRPRETKEDTKYPRTKKRKVKTQRLRGIDRKRIGHKKDKDAETDFIR